MVRALLLVVVMFPSLAAAQKAPPGTVVAGDLGQRLEALVAGKSPSFWGAVLVASEGQVVLAKGQGMQDRQKQAIGPQSLFDLGGATQQLTTALALRLLADRKLRLEDPVSRHLAQWPADKATMTIDHLLRHTSGLPDEAPWVGAAALASRTSVEAIGRAALGSPPGQTFRYSGVNASLLALVLEEVTQQRFDKLLVDRLLKPAGMQTAGPCNGRFDGRWLTWRRSSEKERGEPATAFELNWAHRGARGVLASLLDVHEWLAALCGGKLLDDERLQVLWRPLAGGHAYGVTHLGTGAETLVRVHGQTTGYRVRWLVHRPSRSWIVILSEDYGDLEPLEGALVAELAQHRLRAVDPAPATGSPATAPPAEPPADPAPAAKPTVPAADLERFVGTFALPQGGGTFRIEADGSGLRLHGAGLQASARLLEGAWPTANEARLRAAEDRGLLLLGWLVEAKAEAAAGFADPDAAATAQDLVRSWLQANGPLLRTEFVGTRFVDRAAESWFLLRSARGELSLRAVWSDPQRWSRCTAAAEPAPFAVALKVVRADWAVGASLAGTPLRVSMEGAGDARCLVFEDVSPGAAGLLDCPLVRGAAK